MEERMERKEEQMESLERRMTMMVAERELASELEELRRKVAEVSTRRCRCN